MPPFLFMGFFSSTRTYIASTTVNLVEDTPKVIQQSVLSSVLNKTNKVVDIQNTILYSLANKGSQYYEFGKNKFVHGLPTGTSIGLVADIAKVETVIQGLYGTDNKVLSATIDNFELDFIGNTWLRDNTDWDSTTDTYTYNGLVYKLNNFKVENNRIVVYGTHPTNFIPQPTYRIDSPYLVYQNTSELFYYVTYTDTTVTENPKYWVYLVSDGTYPTLDVEPSQPSSQFYPVVPLRISNKSLTSDNQKDTELYKSSKELLSILDVSIAELEEGVNANPDIEDVDHAYFMLGVAIDSQVEGSQQYLFDFFSNLRNVSRITKDIYTEWKSDPDVKGAPPVNYYHMTDRTWKFYLVYNYIDEVTTQGVIGDVGYTKVDISPQSPIIESYDVSQGQGQSTTRTITYESDLSVVVLTRQVTPTQIKVITVSGLVSFNKIYETNRNYVINLQSVKNDEEILMIPLVHTIVEDMKWEDRNPIYYDSIKVVFNAFEKVKLKWYETGFFKIVTVVLAISLAVFTGGLSSLVTGLTVAASAGIVSLGIMVAKTIVFSYLTKAAFKFVADELGVGVAMALAAVAIVAGASGSLIDLPYADDLLSIGQLGVSSTNEFAMGEIANLTKEFTEMVSLQQEELEASQDELGLNLVQQIDPLDLFTSVGMLPMEQPSAFIERSLTTNIADISNNVITTFFDNQLTLPDLGGLS